MQWQLILILTLAVALMSEVFAVNYNVTLTNLEYLNMSDGCAGNVSIAPNSSYPLDVCVYMNNTDTGICNQITDSEIDWTSSININDSSTLNLSEDYTVYLRWKRIKDNESRYDIGESATGPTNDLCMPISTGGVRVTDDGTGFLGTDSIFACDTSDCSASSGSCSSMQPAYSIFGAAGCTGTEYFYSGKINSTSRIFEGYSNVGATTASLSGADPNNGLCRAAGYSANYTFGGACGGVGGYLGYNHTGDPFGNNLVYLYTGCSDGDSGFASNLSNLCTYAGDNSVQSASFSLNDQSGNQIINTSSSLFLSGSLVWNDYPIIESYGTNKSVPSLNDEIYFWANVSDADGISICEFQARDPNGLLVLDSENATENADNSWNSTSFNANVSGLYWYNITCFEELENLSIRVESGFDDSDVTPPSIIIDAPTGTYSSKSGIPLKWSSEPLRTCYYTLDNGSSNTTISCLVNTTFSVSNNSDYELIFYGEDYGSNQNFTSTLFTVNEPDAPPGSPGGGGGERIIIIDLKDLNEPCIDGGECASGICYAIPGNETSSTCKAGLCGNGKCDISEGESINECFIDCSAKTPAYKMAATIAAPLLAFGAVMFYLENKKKKTKRRY